MTKRRSLQERKTRETHIKVNWDLDGEGNYQIKTEAPFMNHMLELFARHGYFDLSVDASGDTHIDDHHLIEDLGITMGAVLKEAMGSKAGINRYGWCVLPMDESLVMVSLDLSNRPFLQYDVPCQHPLQNFDENLIKDFFSSLVVHAGITLHIKLLAGDNTHHIIEAVFKGFAKALRMALQLNPDEKHVPSTKGIL